MRQSTHFSLSDIEETFNKNLDSVHHPLNEKIKFNTPNFVRYSCPNSQKSNNDAGYIAYTDGRPTLIFVCNRCLPEAQRFPLRNAYFASSKTLQEYKADIEVKKQERLKLRITATEQAVRDFNKATPCISHPYLTNKHVSVSYEDGLRIASNGNLLLPIRLITGEIISIQKVYWDDKQGKFEKRFQSGTSPKNGFHLIGDINSHHIIFFAEGIATCLSIRESTHMPVVCVYGKKFHDIAPIIANAYPGKEFVYCIDHPTQGELDNPKIMKSEDSANKAVSLVGWRICLPDFSSLNLSAVALRQKNLSDFNDLFVELLRKDFSREAALGEVQLQLIHKDEDMISNKTGSNKKINDEETKDNVTTFKTIIKKTDYPELTLTARSMKPLNTYGNLKYMLDRLGISVQWNDMSRIREITIPNFPTFYDDQENSALNEIINLATIHNMPTTKIDDHLNSLAQQNHYHPIVECIKAKPWDGKERLNQFIATLKTTNDGFSYKLIRRWMLSAIAAAFSEKGFASQGVLVLQGKQGIGKTGWVKSLDPINCNAVKEGALLDPANKDNVITLSRYWIVEIGELDGTFRKSDMARNKSHITNQIDEVRAAYARKNSRYARRTAYTATVNVERYLTDDTGNRRWWTVEVIAINLQHGLNMQQVWAEVYHAWNNGEQTWLTDEESKLLSKSNIEYEQIDPFEEKILNYFDWNEGWQKYNTVIMDSSEVLRAIGYANPSRAQATRVGTILVKLTGKKPTRRKHTLPRIIPHS